MSMLSYALDVCQRSLMSWMYVDLHWCPGCMLLLTFIDWMYVDAHRCPRCMLTLTDVPDVSRFPPMSWMYVDAHQCSKCMATLLDVLDVCQHSPMSWMSVDALRCPGCMSMITNVLDVCPCLLMTWMYIDLLIYSSKFLLLMYSDELRFLSANMFWKKIPISTTRYTKIRTHFFLGLTLFICVGCKVYVWIFILYIGLSFRVVWLTHFSYFAVCFLALCQNHEFW